MWHFNTGDCLIEVTAWAGLTVHVYMRGLVGRLDKAVDIWPPA
jgi:hypothetical protein